MISKRFRASFLIIGMLLLPVSLLGPFIIEFISEGPGDFKRIHKKLFTKAEIIAESFQPTDLKIYLSSSEGVHQCLNVTVSIEDTLLPAPNIKWQDETSESVGEWPRSISMKDKSFEIIVTLSFPSSYDGRLVSLSLDVELLVPVPAGWGPTKDWTGLPDHGYTYKPSKIVDNKLKSIYFVKTHNERSLFKQLNEISSIRNADRGRNFLIAIFLSLIGLILMTVGIFSKSDRTDSNRE